MKSQAFQCKKIEVSRQWLRSVSLFSLCTITLFSMVSSSVGQSVEGATQSIAAAPETTISLAATPKPSAQTVARSAADSRFENAPANYHIFPAVGVGEPAGAEVLTLNFSAETTVRRIRSTSKDFVLEPGGTCLEGVSYSRGESCFLLVRFNPQGPGHRLGFIKITHSASATPASVGIAGNGYAPVISFTPAQITTVSTTVSSGAGIISSATNLAVDGGDILYIADIGNKLVRKIDSSGTLVNISPFFAPPGSLAVDSFGDIWAVSTPGNQYYFTEFSPFGSQTAWGITYAPGSCTVSTPCSILNVGMESPSSINIDRNDNLFLEEATKGALEMPVGGYTGGNGTLNLWYLNDTYAYLLGSPTSFAIDPGDNLYTAITYSFGSVCYIEEESLYGAEGTSPVFYRVAGGNVCGFSGDGGQGAGAEISSTLGQIAFDAAGNMYFADEGNQRVRRVDAATGIIRTIAGNGTASNTGDNGPATKATLRTPTGIAVDSQGQVYILSNSASTGTAQVVRKVGTSGDLVFPSTTQNVASAALVLNVANTGNSTLNFVRDTITGTNPGDFSIDNNTTTCNFTAGNYLYGGQNCQIGVIFKPVAVGARSATLNLLDNTVNGTNKVILAGTAVAAAKVSITSPASAQVKAGNKVSITVKVTSSYSIPTGKVNFVVDGKAATSATLTSGAATVAIGPLTTGNHHLVAAYGGDKYHAAAQASETLMVQ